MQAQTNPMNPQGLASLMKGMPQGQPNPMQPNPLQPQPASPGSVSQIRDTYGTNTVPRDLKALMALNEALQMVKSAENQQQLQAQVPQGTVKDQMTQAAQSIMQQAQGVAGASQQQEQEKQAMLQRMLGVAGAPGAAQVMPAQMAMGGVVAFQNMGEVPDPEAMALDELRVAEAARRRDEVARRRELAELREKVEFLQRAGAPRAQIEPLERRMAEISGAQATPVAPQVQPRPPAARSPAARPPAGVATVPVSRPVLSTVGQGITVPNAPTRRDVAPQLGAMEQGSALPALMRQTAGVDGARGTSVQDVLRASGIDPDAIARQREEAARAVYGMSDEEKRIMQERIARMEQEAKPKDTRWYERLGELAARYAQKPVQTRTAGALGGIAGVGAELSRERQTEQQRRRAEIDALQEKFLGSQRQARVSAFETGEAARRAAMGEMIKAGGIGAELTGQQTRARSTEAEIGSREQTERARRESEEVIARLGRETQVKVAQIQAGVRAGGQITPDDLARIRAGAAKSVDDRLKDDTTYSRLRRSNPTDAETQRRKMIEDETKAILDFIQASKPAAGGAPRPTGAPTPTAKPDDPLGIRK